MCASSTLPKARVGWHDGDIVYYSRTMGFSGEVIGTNGYYMDKQRRVLVTKAFGQSASCSTMDPITKFRDGSTEYDAGLGRNSNLSERQHQILAMHVLGCPPKHPFTYIGVRNLLDGILYDLQHLANAYPTRVSHTPGDGALMGAILSRFLLLTGGTQTKTKEIVSCVWATDRVVAEGLGGRRAHLDILCRRLTLFSRVITNHLHIWQQGDNPLLTKEFISNLPPVARDTLLNIKKGRGVTSVTEEHEPNITTQRYIMRNLKECVFLPFDYNYARVLILWFRDFLSNDPPSGRPTDTRGLQNGLFYAFGFGGELTWETDEQKMKQKYDDAQKREELKMLEEAEKGVSKERSDMLEGAEKGVSKEGSDKNDLPPAKITFADC